MVAGALLVALFSPAWLDPATVGELTGLSATQAPEPIPTEFLNQGRSPVPEHSPTASGPSRLVVRDNFDRQVSEGWGSAELGGRYTMRGPLDEVRVAGFRGLASLPRPGVQRAALLREVNVHDVDLRFAVSIDQLPDQGSVYVYGVVRSSVSGSAYRPKLLITPGGAVYAHAGVLLPGSEHSLALPVLVPDIRLAPGDVIWLRARVDGSDPTTIRVRAWASGKPEPTYWHFAVIDWTGSLQSVGAIGVSAYLGSRVTNGPVEVAFADLLATTTDTLE